MDSQARATKPTATFTKESVKEKENADLLRARVKSETQTILGYNDDVVEHVANGVLAVLERYPDYKLRI